MDINKSGVGANFGFKKPDTDNTKETDNLPSSESNLQNKEPAMEKERVTVQEEMDYRDDTPYIDRRTITIALVRNYSKYREANRSSLPKRTDYIGSSISSSRVLSSNKSEVEAYFPQLIGLSPNNNDFINRVKQYLNNIQIKVDELGKTFDISFHYNRRKDYINIVRQEEAIENVYKSANKQDIKSLREALQVKISAINELEGTKYRLGYPINIEDYLMYRHCLLYNDIAKNTALINSDISIRFYFKDDQKEAEKLRKFRQEINKAKANFVTCLSDEDMFDAIFIQYCVYKNLPVISSLLEDRIQREISLDVFSEREPVKFNKMFNNKDTKLIGTIEHLIARGILIRSQYNQNITTNEGTLIGANMLEAIGWFKNPENNSMVNAYYNQLKNI